MLRRATQGMKNMRIFQQKEMLIEKRNLNSIILRTIGGGAFDLN
jgi:hypothetical protein